jgi:hypothetical protein
MLVVVCLTMTLQPCAMAMGGGGDHDCPHCRQSHTQQHNGHNISSDAMAGHDLPCATGAADCDSVDEISVDTRSGQFKLTDTLPDLPVAVISSEPWFADKRAVAVTVVAPINDCPPGVSPPLNILYCVYLN